MSADSLNRGDPKHCPQCGTALDPKDVNYRKKKFCSLECMGLSYRKTPEQRFWAKVDKRSHPKGCWLWTGFLNHDGYGRVGPAKYLNSSGKRAHKLSWEIHFGPVPDGLSVMHLCDVRACVRPDHLKLGTHQENVKDMWVKRRAPTKYTPEIIREIRSKATGKNDRELAAEYGTVPRYIWGIRTRRNWKDI